MDLSIIILNWRAATDTICCIQRLISWKHLQPTIWVVDNASNDGSAETIARACPQIRLIRNPTNLGYAGGNNRGLTKALANSQAPVLLLNNDASVAEKDVIQLLKTLQDNPQIGFIGPLLFDAEQRDRLLTAGGQNMVRHLKSHIPKVTGDKPVQIVDYVPGTVLLGRSEAFHTVGLLDEAYFFNGEMPDLCYRARQYGYLSAVDTHARAFHAIGQSPLRDTLYVYYIIRNRFLFIRKFYHYSKILFYGFWTFYSLILALKLRLRGQTASARAVRLGLEDGLQGQFGGRNEYVLSACGVNPDKVGNLGSQA
ncbi:MAG: glycosyltransferase family 2 protein [Anaerolineae bacterium]|nr:glycosyltransferase family 2 protein [Anaerolineae bacterium]